MMDLRMIIVIHDLKRQGHSVSEISRRTGLDRRTVRKYLERVKCESWKMVVPELVLEPTAFHASA